MEGITGEDSDQFGEKIFDLSDKGCTFRIRCDKQGDFPTYVSSKFLFPSEIPGLDDSRIKEIYAGGHDLKETFRTKTYEELKAMLDEHFHCVDPNEVVATPTPVAAPVANTVEDDDDDEIPMGDTPSASDTDEDPLEDDKVRRTTCRSRRCLRITTNQIHINKAGIMRLQSLWTGKMSWQSLVYLVPSMVH